MKRALVGGILLCASCAPNVSPETPMQDRTKRENRLAAEKSPYLRQHKHNPVNWHPWGETAFRKAKEEDKVIFLSIGYSTCHWCHVMERESFESEDIARVLNEHFVSIKVDREERPDVDQIYMAAALAMNGHGGWPLSAFLTPDREPFFAGTYWPPERFKEILSRIAALWTTERAKLLESGKALVEAIAGSDRRGGGGGALTADLLDRAAEQFEQQFDPEHGGFGSSPKFPRSVTLEFLLRMHRRSGSGTALKMVRAQLDGMRRGGIYDQLGGGFHRYSTDTRWLVPHFEKMLYDNALLVRSYVRAWQITRDSGYERVVRETCDYVLRDMTAPQGGFYSAEDADSEGFEGTFYVWTPAQVKRVVPGRDGDLLCRALGVVEGGNWEPHEAREPRGNSVLHVAAGEAELAKEFRCTVEEARRILENGKKKLFEARACRPRPHRDDKILTEWNAMMIGALVEAGTAFEEPRYLESAEKAARFLYDNLRRADGRYLRRYCDGEAAIPAFLDDYAWVTEAWTLLYQATSKIEYLREAIRTAEQMIDLFGAPAGGFYFSGKDQEALVARIRDIYDGALPSGNAVAAHALLRLAEFTMREPWRRAAVATMERFAAELTLQGSAFPHLCSAVEASLTPWTQIVLAGDAPEMRRAIRGRYLPNAILVQVPAEGADPETLRLLPFVEGRKAIRGQPAAHVCRNHACDAPVTRVEKLESLLDRP
ncbi:MAG: thioredoxin domain-containing protein [Planctomycetes bacterium]|nr:thioredoxin domain-containing protein [Planctomycetota bacterium]